MHYIFFLIVLVYAQCKFNTLLLSQPQSSHDAFVQTIIELQEYDVIYAVNPAASADFQTLMTDVSGCIVCIKLNLSALSLTFSPPHQSHNPQREPPIENEWEASARLRTSGHVLLVRSLSGSKNSFISFSPFKKDPVCVLKETAFNIIHCFHHLLFCAHEIFI